MILHSFRSTRFRTMLSVLFAGLCVAAVPSAGQAHSGQHARSAIHENSLLLCKPASMPFSAGSAAHGHRLVLQLGDGRFFAPTRSAMFFSHPGDRCTWHGAVAARS